MLIKGTIAYAILCGFIFFNYGCTNNKCNNNRIVTSDIGENKELRRCIDECENNRILYEQEFLKIPNSKSIANGYYKEFYPTGKLKVFGFYRDNVQDSIGFQYYPDGNIQVKSFKSEGSFYGPQYVYYNSGALKSIMYHKSDSIAWFGISYQQSGEIAHVYGKAIRTMAKPGFEKTKVGKVFGLLNEVAILPKSRTILSIRFENNNIIEVDTIATNFSKINNTNIFPFKTRITKVGLYNYIASVKIVDSLSGDLIRQDSIHLTLRAE